MADKITPLETFGSACNLASQYFSLLDDFSGYSGDTILELISILEGKKGLFNDPAVEAHVKSTVLLLKARIQNKTSNKEAVKSVGGYPAYGNTFQTFFILEKTSVLLSSETESYDYDLANYQIMDRVVGKADINGNILELNFSKVPKEQIIKGRFYCNIGQHMLSVYKGPREERKTENVAILSITDKTVKVVEKLATK